MGVAIHLFYFKSGVNVGIEAKEVMLTASSCYHSHIRCYFYKQ